MNALRQRWRRWVDERSPRLDRQTFTQRNVYIVPGRGGLGFAAVVLVLLLASINEQLNLGYALAFLLGGVGLSAMWLTHGNLRGLSLSLGAINSVHAGQALQVPVVLDAGELKRGRYGLLMSTTDAQGMLAVPAEVAAGHQTTATLAIPAEARGWMTLPRLRVLTTYPLGLFRAWGYWRTARRVLIWPALEARPPALPDLPADGGGTVGLPTTHVELPDGLRPWRQGDTLRTIAWKKSANRLASGLDPVSREASGRPRLERWIDWTHAAGLPTEARLSRLASWVVMAERQALHDGQPYGLRLPGVTIACTQGSAHMHRCLDTLAAWGQDP